MIHCVCPDCAKLVTKRHELHDFLNEDGLGLFVKQHPTLPPQECEECHAVTYCYFYGLKSEEPNA